MIEQGKPLNSRYSQCYHRSRRFIWIHTCHTINDAHQRPRIMSIRIFFVVIKEGKDVVHIGTIKPRKNKLWTLSEKMNRKQIYDNNNIYMLCLLLLLLLLMLLGFELFVAYVIKRELHFLPYRCVYQYKSYGFIYQ